MTNVEEDFSQQFKVTKEGNFDFTKFSTTKNRGQLALNIFLVRESIDADHFEGRTQNGLNSGRVNRGSFSEVGNSISCQVFFLRFFEWYFSCCCCFDLLGFNY